MNSRTFRQPIRTILVSAILFGLAAMHTPQRVYAHSEICSTATTCTDPFPSRISLTSDQVRSAAARRASQPDFNGDRIAETVIVGKRGEAPFVKVIDGRIGKTLFYFYAYDPSFRGGVSVAIGDLDADGIPEIVTVPVAGAIANVKVFNGKDAQLQLSFLAFDPSFQGGALVSISNVNGDSQYDIVVVAQVDGHTQKKAFDGKTLTLLSNTIG